MESPLLKLAGTDAEDIAILSAVLQDSVILASEIRHDAQARQFSFIAQRFRWEAKDAPEGCTRANCRVTAFGVTGVAARGGNDDRALALLALDLADPPAALTVRFADGGDLRLTLVPGWRLQLEDFGEPWPCQSPKQYA